MYWQTLLTAGTHLRFFVASSSDCIFLSCCVDEVAAQHIDADAMVHYGHACMSLYVSIPIILRLFGLFWGRTSRLPVIYVFGKKTVDIDLCVKQLVEAFDVDLIDGNDMEKNAILLKHDVVFAHQAGISLSSYSLLSHELTCVIIHRCNN